MYGLYTESKELTPADLPAVDVALGVNSRGLESPNAQTRLAALYAIHALTQRKAALVAEQAAAHGPEEVALAAGAPVVGEQVEATTTVELPGAVQPEMPANAAV
jgi:hypothetical protein